MTRALIIATIFAMPFSASPAIAQTLGQGQDSGIPLLRLAFALLLCISLAVAAALALRYRMNGRAAWPDPLAALRCLAAVSSTPAMDRLSDIETRRLSGQVAVSVFTCGGRDYLLAHSIQGQMVLVDLREGRQSRSAKAES